MAETFAKPAERYVIKMVGEGRPIVLDRAEVETAKERIRKAYNVQNEQNLSE